MKKSITDFHQNQEAIQHHSFTVKKKAHYYTTGTPSSSTKYFWIICHGYGQLASDFIKDFSILDSDEHFVLAPEGLSRFYWKGFSGRIAASWMTSKDRLDEIDDYTNMIGGLYDEYRVQLPNAQIILLGFSQGCATQVRWIMRKLPQFDTLVMWAGLFPEDLDYSPQLKYLNQKEMIFAYGDEDQFLNEAYIIAQKNFIEERGLKMKYLPFKGKHKVEEEALAALLAKLKILK